MYDRRPKPVRRQFSSSFRYVTSPTPLRLDHGCSGGWHASCECSILGVDDFEPECDSSIAASDVAAKGYALNINAASPTELRHKVGKWLVSYYLASCPLSQSCITLTRVSQFYLYCPNRVLRIVPILYCYNVLIPKHLTRANSHVWK